jgi:NAD(P)-dependent dehydrogenase (short-subunit alcohol dehydrogenase family)
VNRIVIVTGGSAGLGRALVREAAKRGDIAVAFGRDPVTLAETAAGVEHGRCEVETVDVSDFTAVTSAVHGVLERHGRIDGLFCNAAVYPRISLVNQDPDDWMQVLTINVGGVMATMRAVLPAMMREARGRIVVVGSFADISPLPESSAYSVSKGALHPLVRAVEAELAGDFPDILVNEWIPGSLRTRMGVPEGLEPADAACWGLNLLDLPAGGPSGRMFNRDEIVDPPQSLKRRIMGKLLRR